MDISKPYSYRNVDGYFQFNLLFTCDACLTTNFINFIIFAMFFDNGACYSFSINIKFQRSHKRAVNTYNHLGCRKQAIFIFSGNSGSRFHLSREMDCPEIEQPYSQTKILKFRKSYQVCYFY